MLGLHIIEIQIIYVTAVIYCGFLHVYHIATVNCHSY
jgi:hypothetical protein